MAVKVYSAWSSDLYQSWDPEYGVDWDDIIVEPTRNRAINQQLRQPRGRRARGNDKNATRKIAFQQANQVLRRPTLLPIQSLNGLVYFRRNELNCAVRHYNLVVVVEVRPPLNLEECLYQMDVVTVTP
ncbi:uncharacterized protein CIMG_11463 [Coccidioides immitis RS]|uniref:Uncharacterized protein n=1 Tax=Coccidioides immitis (strain RS) TaxID=246410 RepID=A0A0D8JVX0_COCIM|nr:uncharacterized protein CIMG_11463 [Coccidioides immitis RS]KJF61091.1 hypothetical protein CIMG_11463 [Coccidioides immitis RS]